MRDGELRVPHGYVARSYVRAVETNTIFHVRPGARALTFGMYGCGLRCGYCHNAGVSQALRDPTLVDNKPPTDVDAEALVERAVRDGCEVLCAAYNEPMIAVEWVREIFLAAKRRGLVTAIISDGHSTPEALAYVRDAADVYRVDLKGYTEEHYRALGGHLAPVLASIRRAKELGFWVEVVTLVVPGFNDEESGLRQIARQLAAIDLDIPWHVNGFVPRYRMQDRPPTSASALALVAGSAYARGLRHVYVSNVPGQCADLSHTRCPSCAHVVIRRANYETVSNELRKGACPACGTRIPGIFRDET